MASNPRFKNQIRQASLSNRKQGSEFKEWQSQWEGDIVDNSWECISVSRRADMHLNPLVSVFQNRSKVAFEKIFRAFQIIYFCRIF